MKHPLLTSDTMSIKGKELLNKIKDDFIGLDTKYKTVDGKISFEFSVNLDPAKLKVKKRKL